MVILQPVQTSDPCRLQVTQEQGARFLDKVRPVEIDLNPAIMQEVIDLRFESHPQSPAWFPGDPNPQVDAA
jgi:hypothetical protein